MGVKTMMTMSVAAMLVAAAPVLGQAAAPAKGQATDAKQIEKGMAVYAAQKCSICHSIEGKGQVKGPLDGVGSKLTADEIRQWIVNPAEMTKKHEAERKPAMRAYPKLAKEDLDALVAYMASLKKK